MDSHVTRHLPVICYRYKIENGQYATEDLHKYCKMVVRKCETDFVVNLPYRGEFALRVYKLDDNYEPTNVCNYLFTDANDYHKREVRFSEMA